MCISVVPTEIHNPVPYALCFLCGYAEKIFMSGRQTILFVDDEQNVLNSLRRLLYDEPWDLLFAESGAAGLEVLEKEDVDLVISDIRMPLMEGVEFLKQVKERHPRVLRIFLSGHADRGAVVEALAEGCAQQILPKPWKDAELKEVIRTALLQANDLKKKNTGLQQIINALSSLRTMPQTYLELKKCFSHINTVSIESLAEIIEQDASVSAEVLRWANSALFGQMRKVDTVERALMVLGIDILEGLVLSHSIYGSISSVARPVGGFDLKAFQTHSLACGILSKLLVGEMSHVDPKDADRAFTAGLLHDVGKLVEERYLADEFRKIIDAARQGNTLVIEAEYEVLSTTHDEIGNYLAQWWSMPSFLINAIRWHHKPKLCKADQIIVSAVHAANALVQKFELGSSGNFRLPSADASILEFFEIRQEDLPELKEKVAYYLS
ncbi:MAG: HDOD domain-containing protein [Nitrospirae bacterium]|nr:HDOD domain-containing protein [Nitrospirota bacterium]